MKAGRKTYWAKLQGGREILSLPLRLVMDGKKGFERPKGISSLPMDLVDAYYMKEAMAEGRKAGLAGEVPVGAILVLDGQVISRGRNRVELDQDPLAHAELVCLSRAFQAGFSRYDLGKASLYVSLEPCPMCAGAILNARLGRLVFGAYDPRMGACGTAMDVLTKGRSYWRVKVKGGVLEEDNRARLETFFDQVRK